MADSTTSTQPTSPNSSVDLTGFIQSYKIGPVLQAKALRDQLDLASRNAERCYERAHGLPTAQQQKAEDDVIQVDSPTTNITHHHPPTAPVMGIAAKALLALAVSGPVGAGIALLPLVQAYLAKSPTVSPSGPIDPLIFDLKLGPPK